MNDNIIRLSLCELFVQASTAHYIASCNPSVLLCLRTGVLRDSHFPNGLQYFESNRRTFPSPCPECVILHNNWLMGKAAKIHRFKEHLLWFVDEDSYYSNQRARYLVYDNPLDVGASRTPSLEVQAFKNALFLARILDRILILPKFHCGGCRRYQVCQRKRCPLQTYVSIATLERYFLGAYREHSFLCHPWVPARFKNFNPPLVSILTQYLNTTLLSDKTFVPRDVAGGPTRQEIEQWFITPKVFSKHAILRVHNMYGSFGNLYKEPAYAGLVKKLKQAIVPSEYRQY